LIEAWAWLERAGILIRDPNQPAGWFFISSRGQELLVHAATSTSRSVQGDVGPMPTQADCFEEFLRKVDPLMQSLYQSLEFACIAAKPRTEWILISGKALLTTEPHKSGAQIMPLVHANDLLALTGRIGAVTIKNLVHNLRKSWVIDVPGESNVRLVEEGADAYNWLMPAVHSIDKSSNYTMRWKRAFSVYGNGPNPSPLLSYSAWQEIDSELRRSTPAFNGLNGLCARLGLPVLRSNPTSSFQVSAELPAQFEGVHTDSAKGSLEIDIRCCGAPDLMIEWLPQHDFQRLKHGWQRDGNADLHHVSVLIPSQAQRTELMLSFAELEPADSTTHDIFDKADRASPQKPRPTFESAFHSYTLDGPVGEGGAGTVFRAHSEKGDLCAIKRLDPRKTTSEKLKRFENELTFCKNEPHRNIVKVLDEGFATVGGEKAPFYVMPFYPKTLRQLMTEEIPNEKILPYFAQVLDGVEAAHLRKVWHRDLKPENILCDPVGNTLVVADFGIAHFEEEDLHTAVETKDGVRLASFQYAAPEQRVRGKIVDQRADIYALGLILNEMFTRETLQGAGYKRIASVAPQLEYLDEIVEVMVQQSPGHRPDSIDALRLLLSARGQEYVSRQKLSALREAVISASQIDDPLINEPVRATPIDYRGGKIIFTLSQPVNHLWTEAFVSQTVLQYPSGLSPQDFAISGTTVELRANEKTARSASDYLNRYIQGATSGYRRKLEEAQRKSEENDRRALQNQIDEEEKRKRVLGILKGKT